MMDFDEFLRTGAVTQRMKSMPKARSLAAAAEDRMRFLKSIRKTGENATYMIENAYDIIREFAESRLAMDGYDSGSHEATISYLGKIGFSPAEVGFIDDLRKNRNRIKYYGKSMDLGYALEVLEFLDRIYEKLRDMAMKP
jgi:hypothetical protein